MDILLGKPTSTKWGLTLAGVLALFACCGAGSALFVFKCGTTEVVPFQNIYRYRVFLRQLHLDLLGLGV
jgi:hypothetical protein